MSIETIGQVIDRVESILLTQGCRALKDSSTHICAYRGKNGTKCAIGHLIPDENYKADMEGESAVTLLAKYPLVLGRKPTDGMVTILTRCQGIHDNYYPKNWRENFRQLREFHISLLTAPAWLEDEDVP